MGHRTARPGAVATGAALSVVLGVLVTACGGSDGTTSDPTDRPPVSTAAVTSSGASSGSPTGTAATGNPSTSTSVPTSPAPSGAASTRPPVGLDGTGVFRAGLTATVTAIEPLTATAALPGEIAGPAVRLTVAVQNGLGTAIDLGNVTVDLQDAAAASATPLSGNGARPLTGSLAPGASTTGVYVFSLAADDRDGVTLYVTASAALPVVVFAGDLS